MRPRIVALLGLLAAPASLAWGAEPWDFARPADRADAQRKHGKGYFYEYYKKAEQILQGDASRAGEAIELLRLAIAERPDSSLATQLPGRQVSEYFPYYHLADAFSRKGEYAAAERCLRNESREISKSRLAASFTNLSASIGALALRDTLLAQVDRVRAWEGAAAEVILSPDGRAKVGPLAGLADGLRKARTAEVKSLADQVKGALIDLAAGELRAHGTALAKLAAEPWKGAFARNPDQVAPSACQATPGRDDAAAAVAAVERCSQAVTQASRAAGEWTCADLAKVRGDVQKQFEALQAWASTGGGGTPAAPAPIALPASCIKWKEAPVAQVIASLRTLETEGAEVRRVLLAKLDELGKELDKGRAGLLAKLDAARQQLPDLPVDCARDLQLGKAAEHVRTLRDRLAPERLRGGAPPPTDLLNPDPLVKRAFEELVARMKDGVQQLQRSGNCPEIRTANLQALPGALEGYLGRSREAELTSLCAAARGARSDVRECWVKNIGVVRASLGRAGTLLDAARAAAGGADGPACLLESLAAVRRAQSGPATGSEETWVHQALTEGDVAQACLKDFHAMVKEDHIRIEARVQDAREMLEAMADLPGPGESKDGTLADILKKTAGMKQDLQTIAARLQKVAPLYEDGAASQVADLRSSLEAAGLGSALPGGIWPLLGGAGQGGGQADGEAWLVTRDAAVLPELRRADRALDAYQPTIVKLGPFAALNRAFGAFDRGDLDGAILALREAQAKGFLPRAGKEAALAHAALAYFLHTKGRALSAGSVSKDLTESMHRDVQQEARLALHADAGFTPPEGLFRSRSFMETFQACRDEIRDETRTGVR